MMTRPARFCRWLSFRSVLTLALSLALALSAAMLLALISAPDGVQAQSDNGSLSLAVTERSASSLTVQWGQVADVVTYTLILDGGDDFQIHSASPGEDTHTFTDLQPDFQYRLIISAFRSDASSAGEVQIYGRTRPLPPTPTPVVVPEVSIAAGPEATEGSDAVFTVTANPAPASDLTVELTITASGDVIGDGQTGPQTVTVPSGGSATYAVSTVDDDVVESPGTITATLVSPSGGYTVAAAPHDVATVSVTSEDQLSRTPTISTGFLALVRHGFNEYEPALFKVSARPTPDQPLLVNVRLTQEGDFYDPADLGIKQFLIPAYRGGPGDHEHTLYEVNPIDDHLAEPNGTLTLEVLPGTGYRVGTRSRTEEVHDSDLTEEEHKNYTPEIRVSGRNSGHEEGDDYRFKFSSGKSLASPVPITVEISQTGDFVAPEHLGTRQLTIPAAPSHAYLTIPTVDDRVDEPDGRVVVRVLPGDGYVAAGWHGQEHGGDDFGSALVKDNDIDGAIDLPLDTPTSGAIADENDVDVFRFVLTESTLVVVAEPSAFEAYNYGPTFVVLDSTGNQLQTGGIAKIRLAAGMYYARAEPDSLWTGGDYQVVVKTIPDYPDTMENAHPVNVWNGRQTDNPPFFTDFHSTTDVDFFKFELEETTEIHIDWYGVDLLYGPWGGIGAYNLDVLDSNGNYVRTPRVGTFFYGGFYRLEAGTWYIRLSPLFLFGNWYAVNEPWQIGGLDVLVNNEYTEFFDGCSAISTTYDDPLYGCQWHLDNTSENPGTPGEDINVEAAWSTTQGAGINVAIVDDAAEFDHPDLRGNWNSQLSHDYPASLTRTPDPWARHGRAVAGIIAAQGNSIGVRGVAPQATIYGYNLSERSTLANAVDAMTRNSTVTAVSNNSWVFSDNDGIRYLPEAWDTALETGIRDGYHGKGTFYVFGAGNDHLHGYHVNLSEGKNHHAQTLVCAVDPDGKRSPKSETGYSLWLCAPEASVTTYLWDRYSEEFGGTSAATAVVSGVAALLRSANPSLTWRDLKLILAASARKNDAADPGWETGAYQYGSNTERYSYNPQYGFGVVDAGAAVSLATNWTNLPPMKSVTAYSPTVQLPIPDGGGTTISSEITLNTDIDFTEFVEVKVDITHPAFRDLGITLTSPSGATSHLAVPSGTAPDGELNAKFRLGSARHLGENPSGVWTLEIEDHESGDAGSFKGWEITVYGHRGALPGNSPATGRPVVSGALLVGRELTASTSAIADPDGLTNVEFAYQWLSGDTLILGATGPTYTTVAADLGKVIKVMVSFTDDAGNTEKLFSDGDTITVLTLSIAVADELGRVTEGENVKFIVTSNYAPAVTLIVNVDVRTSGDYGVNDHGTSIRIAAGKTSGTGTWRTTDDSTDEADGSITVTIWDIYPRGTHTVSATQGAATVIVADNDDPIPEVSVTAGSGVTEGGDATFTVTASPSPAADLDVSVTVSQSGDYGAVAGQQTVTIPTTGSVTLTVATTGDDVDEPDGSVTATLDTPAADAGYTVSTTQGAATVTVSDDDAPPTPEVSVTAGSGVTEGGDATFTITASPTPTANLDVSVTVSQSGDYGAVAGQQTVTIPTTGSVTLTVATTGDDVDEPDGSVTATLDAPAADAGYTVSATQGAATVTVSDDDAPPTPEVSVTAGSGVTEGGDTTFTVTANPAPAANLDVSVTVSASGDYGATTGQQTVTVLAAAGSVTLTIATTGDDVDEPDGSVTATLDTPPADAGYTVSATQGAATVSVSDDDDPAPTPGYTVDPEVIAAVEYLASQTHHGTAHVNRWQRALVALGALDPSGVSGGALTLAEARQNANAYSSPVWDQVVAELEAKEAFEAAQQTPPPTPVVSITGASGGTEGEAVTFTVSAHPAPAEDLAVSATVATSGDYGVTAGSRTVTIAADTTSKTLTLQTTDDATDEADGSVTLTLNDGSGYTVSATQGAATASVSDDDPVVSISGGGGVTEGGDASFTITANPAPAADLDVSVTVSQSGDYGATTGQQTVTILAATGSATLTVSTTNDDADEADGSVTATLDTPPADAGYTVSATQGAATVAVSDDDAPAPTPGYTVDPQVIAAVEYLASQTHHGTAHVNRWQRALVALGALDPAGVSGGALTLAEARQNANAYSSPVWDQVVAELEAKEAFEAAQQTPPPTPVVSITGASGGTEGEAVTFTVSANPAPATDLSVSATVATSGDYGVIAGPRTVTIAADTTSKTLTLQTTDDSTDEADGSVTLTLNDGSGYTLGQVSSETAQVQDDDDASPQPQQQPVVSISGGGGVTEGGNASFTITASPEPASPITVNVTVSASGDYGATTGSRTVTVTTTGSAILTVGTTDDGNDEADGSVTATLVDGADYDLGTNQAATVSVADDDVPVVSISGGGGVTEGGDASFTITASPVPAADLTVNVTVTASGDYGATTGSRTVTVPTTGSAVLTVGTTDDGNDEADGSVTATLVDGAGYDLGTNQAATVSVADDDDAPPVVTPVVSITAGSGVTEGGDASFTITANPVPAADLSVSVTVSASGDYGATTGSRTVTIPATGSTILTVGTTDDGNDEADGSVTATLVDGADYDLGTNQAATVSVADDDVPVVSISGGSGVTEGGDASFTITASPVPAADLTVNVTVSASGDYGATTGSRTVTVPTTGSAILTVGTTDDGNDEADGSVTATVNAGDGYAVSSSQGAATVIVSDDDDAPTSETAVTISIEDASASENDTDLVFRVTLSEASNEDVTVQWATSHSQSPDRARGGQGYDYDFWHAVGEIVIRAGETSGTGAVWLNQDSKDEPDEVFTVTLSSPKGATLEREEGTMTIIDDD